MIWVSVEDRIRHESWKRIPSGGALMGVRMNFSPLLPSRVSLTPEKYRSPDPSRTLK